ncbi:MAG: precorrin-8X methylmutase [Verrucomicrobiia bacterium]|jgi:cobalt/nickel transport system ATP-binding protein/precorrin-8X/cobalt-precorrin-8 methylmutase
MTQTPFIRKFLEAPLSGPEIEERSFEAIDHAARHNFSSDQWEIVRRMIHTTGDLTLGELVRFSPDAIESGVAALRQGRPIYVDSNMIRAGLSLPRLKSANAGYDAARVFCHVADADVARQSAESNLPRSLFAIRKAKPMLDGGIVAFGNAPVALLELNRMIIEDRIRPALVLAMPVGFVHVIESKEELLSLPVPHVAVAGTRGGSTLAVAAIHAFCTLAAQSAKKEKQS